MLKNNLFKISANTTYTNNISVKWTKVENNFIRNVITKKVKKELREIRQMELEIEKIRKNL